MARVSVGPKMLPLIVLSLEVKRIAAMGQEKATERKELTVERVFERSRLEKQLMATSFETLVPVIKKPRKVNRRNRGGASAERGNDGQHVVMEGTA